MRSHLQNIGVVAVAFVTSFCQAQGERQWIRGAFAPGPLDFSGVSCIESVDHDGDGPEPPVLYVGGSFFASGDEERSLFGREGIKQFRGGAWGPVGTGIQGEVWSLEEFDPDGPGPQPKLLIAGGLFEYVAETTQAMNVAYWDGNRWRPMGMNLPAGPRALLTVTEHDWPGLPDPILCAAPAHSGPVSETPSGVWYWAGTEWTPLGTMNTEPGTHRFANDLALFDFDGAGGEPAQLVVAGKVQLVGDEAYTAALRWDGHSWRPIGGPLGDAAYDVVAFDADGVRPAEAVLIVCGSFEGDGETEPRYLAQWDGVSWQPLGLGVDASIGELFVWEPADSGLDTPLLIASHGNYTTAGGVPVDGVAAWDGARWLSLFPTLDPQQAETFCALRPEFTRDGRSLLLAGGNFHNIGNEPANLLAAWDGEQWRSFGAPTNSWVFDLLAVEEAGEHYERGLYIGGNFTLLNGQAHHAIARWDGQAYHALGEGMSAQDYPAQVAAMILFDDPTYPCGPRLIAGGQFETADGVPARSIARWTGSAWEPMGGGTEGDVRDFAVYDADGPGGEPAALYAAGRFEIQDDEHGSLLKKWTGVTWEPIGDFGGDGFIRAATAFNHDMDGQALSYLYFVGAFSSPGEDSFSSRTSLGRSDGQSFEFLDEPESAISLLKWDPDGQGPIAEHLYIGSRNRLYVSNADGSAEFNSFIDFTGLPYAMTPFDPDGDGPVPPSLVIGGDISSGATYSRRLDNISVYTSDRGMQPMTFGIAGDVLDGAQFDHDNDPDTPHVFVAAGVFSAASGQPAGGLAMWDRSPPGPLPKISKQLDDYLIVEFGGRAEISIEAQGEGPLAFQWRQWGNSMGGSIFFPGIRSPTLVIGQYYQFSRGWYDVVIWNDHGSVVSDRMFLVAPLPCIGDTDYNNQVNEYDAISVFFEFGKVGAPGESTADVNLDGVVDMRDLNIVIGNLGSGCN